MDRFFAAELQNDDLLPAFLLGVILTTRQNHRHWHNLPLNHWMNLASTVLQNPVIPFCIKAALLYLIRCC